MIAIIDSKLVSYLYKSSDLNADVSIRNRSIPAEIGQVRCGLEAAFRTAEEMPAIRRPRSTWTAQSGHWQLLPRKTAASPICESQFFAASARSMNIAAHANLVLQQYGQKTGHPGIHYTSGVSAVLMCGLEGGSEGISCQESNFPQSLRKTELGTKAGSSVRNVRCCQNRFGRSVHDSNSQKTAATLHCSIWQSTANSANAIWLDWLSPTS